MSAPKCEVSWPVEDDGEPFEHTVGRLASYVVTWEDKQTDIARAGGYGKAHAKTHRYLFTCCEEHAIAAQAWGNVSVYRLELVDSPEGLSRGEEPGE